MNKKIVLYSLVAVLLFLQSSAQNSTDVRTVFLLTAPALSADSTVYIAGSNQQLGQWNPGAVKMEYTGNHTWRKVALLPAASSVEYKYTLGSWQRQGANVQGQSLENFHRTITQNLIISDTVLQWTMDLPQKNMYNTISGTVRYHYAMHADNLANRDVLVWLPPSYEKDSAKRYPVIYMQDGQNLFNAATSSFGVEWRMDEICDSLIRVHAIPPVIVVGIYNTASRSEEYAPGALGNAYMHFVVNQLKPFIDSAYRTLRDSRHTLVGGASSGGLIAFILAWQYPQVFSKAICMSPALKISQLDYVKVVQASAAKKKPVYWYMDIGGIGLESQLAPGIHDMVKALEARGYKANQNFLLVTDTAAQHNEAAWSKRLPTALKWCFSRK